VLVEPIGHSPTVPIVYIGDTVQVVQVATGRLLYGYTLGKVPIKKKKKKNTQNIICEIICLPDHIDTGLSYR
jgi:hypothetical protein